MILSKICNYCENRFCDCLQGRLRIFYKCAIEVKNYIINTLLTLYNTSFCITGKWDQKNDFNKLCFYKFYEFSPNFNRCADFTGVYLSSSSLKYHVKVIHEGLVHECNICQARLRRRDKMRKHMLNKHGFDDQLNFTIVVEDQPPENIALCVICCKGHAPVDQHYECTTCGEQFIKISTRDRHMRSKHKAKEKKVKPEYDESNPMHCHACRKAIVSETYQIYHMDTQHVEKKDFYQCRFCDYRVKLRFPTCLLEHLRTHTGERPEKCSTCGQCFKTKKTLANHYKTHSNKRKTVVETLVK